MAQVIISEMAYIAVNCLNPLEMGHLGQMSIKSLLFFLSRKVSTTSSKPSSTFCFSDANALKPERVWLIDATFTSGFHLCFDNIREVQFQPCFDFHNSSIVAKAG